MWFFYYYLFIVVFFVCFLFWEEEGGITGFKLMARGLFCLPSTQSCIIFQWLYTGQERKRRTEEYIIDAFIVMYLSLSQLFFTIKSCFPKHLIISHDIHTVENPPLLFHPKQSIIFI